jgi:hypothetical protein
MLPEKMSSRKTSDEELWQAEDGSSVLNLKGWEARIYKQ